MSAIRMETALLGPLVEACRNAYRESGNAAHGQEMNALVAYMRPFVVNIATSIVRRKLWDDNSARHTGEDVTNEALMRFVKHFPQIDDISTITGWFVRVIANLVVDLRRARNARAQEDLTDEATEPELGTRQLNDDIALLTETRWLVLEAVRKLSEEHRDVVFLAYWGQLTPAEIARHLGIPEGTAKSRLHYANQYLRTSLSDTTTQHALAA